MPEHAGPEAVGATILLVDDEEIVRHYCRRALESDGARVVEAGDGATALRLVEEGPADFDLVITDVRMPVIGGLEVAEVLSVFRPGLPVLAISADVRGTTDRRLELLPKPFTADQLLAAARRARAHIGKARALTEENRVRARRLRERAAADALRIRERIDLVGAAMELQRLNREGETGTSERRG